MRIFRLLLLIATIANTAYGQKLTLSELYDDIDKAISESPKYTEAYEHRIDSVRALYGKTRTGEQRLQLTRQLSDLYRSFNNDSALAYMRQNIAIADSMGLHQEANHARALLAFQCSTVGLYTEALGILHPIKSSTLSQEGRQDYFMACMHVCGELAFYTKLDDMHDYYSRLHNEYRDSLFSVADHNSETYLLWHEMQLLNEHEYDQALAVNDQRMKLASPGSHQAAIVCYYRHRIYDTLGDTEQSKYWLALSALYDIKNAVMDQASLIELANLLNNEGRYEQSYRYIRFTWDCNSRFNTRMRSWQINPILTVIEKNYEKELERRSNILKLSIIGISILALLLAAALFYSWKERQQLRRARSEQEQSNRQLKALNKQLESQTTELTDLNAQHASLIDQLSALNGQLSEANQVKEEYIGRFLSLCSQYVNKLDDYRKMVNRKMKNRDLDELFQITKSTELKEKELEELYENFDSVFLHLFPSFVEDFNSLLLPEYQIRPKEEHRLTTDIRIFALIRLGIEDSSKIAEFLHKSVNTIYNYRARIKNGASGNRELFEQQVKTIGRYGV